MESSPYEPSRFTPKPMPSSRLIKKQQNTLMLQSAFFIGLAVVLSGLGIFVVVPNVVKLVGGKVDPSSLRQDNSIPPQVPVLIAPLEATSSAKFVLNGYTEKDTEVVLVNNGSEVSRTKTDGDGNFRFEFDLQNGSNAIATYAVNDKKVESSLSQQYSISLDSEAPKLEISEPTDKATIQGKKNQNVTIKGQSEPTARITLNDRLLLIKADGSFSTQFRLNTGENALSIKAQDQAGNVKEVVLTITFNE